MTKQNNIPDWAFKAFAATMGILVLITIWALGLLYELKGDVSVVKDRSRKYENVEALVNSNSQRIQSLETKLSDFQTNNRSQSYGYYGGTKNNK